MKLSDGEAKEVELNKDGESLKLMGVPDGKIEDEDKISRVSSFFESLDFDDVRAKSTDAKPAGASVSVETNTGLSLTISAAGPAVEKQHWVRIEAASFKDEAKDKANELAAKLDGFEFKFNTYDSEVLGWPLANFTKDQQS